MTKAERLEAYRMRLDGVPVIEIAQHFGVSRQHLYDILPVSGKPVRGCIYPHINEWITDNDSCAQDLANRAGVSYNGLSEFLKGNVGARKPTIDKILEVTGMTYEYAFATEVSDGSSV